MLSFIVNLKTWHPRDNENSSEKFGAFVIYLSDKYSDKISQYSNSILCLFALCAFSNESASLTGSVSFVCVKSSNPVKRQTILIDVFMVLRPSTKMPRNHLEAPSTASFTALLSQMIIATLRILRQHHYTASKSINPSININIRTEKAFRKTRHCMMPSIVSPVRQNVPVRWRPLRPMADAVTMEGTRALLEPGPRGRLLLVLPADDAALSAGMRRSSESIPTTGGLIRTTRVQTFIPISTVLPLQHVRLSHTSKAQVTHPVLHYSGSPERKVSERKVTGAPSFYTSCAQPHGSLLWHCLVQNWSSKYNATGRQLLSHLQSPSQPSDAQPN